MKAMRQILSDRMLATALAVVLAYLLVFQGFAGNLARASMPVATASALHVMCGGSSVSQAPPLPGTGSPAQKRIDCPCSNLCRSASPAAAALAPGALILARPALRSYAVIFGNSSAPEPEQRTLFADARGPPFA